MTAYIASVSASSAVRRTLAAVSVFAFVWAAAAATARASALGDLAAQMRPGEWRVLNQSGDASGFNYDLLVSCNGADCGDNILNYADKALWNPITREIHFIGKGHLRDLKHISYNEAANRWAREAKPYWDCSGSGVCYGIGHGFEHSAIDPTTGNVYARLYNSSQVFKWTRATKTWSELPPGPVTSSVAVAIEYFPDLGGLLLVGGGEVHLYRESSRAWVQLAQGLAMGPYSHVASYNPVHKVAIVGGGDNSTRLYRVDSAGRVTAIANAPAAVGVQSSVFTVDPASGKYLLFGSSGGFYEYDVAANAWSPLSSSGVLMFSAGNSYNNRILFRSAVPISTHGVVAFLALDGSDARVFLYRHAPGATPPPADTTPPAPPSGLAVQ
ncbi:MAG: hypothetical protein AB1761_02930 [Pseudomonadota bacterium]